PEPSDPLDPPASVAAPSADPEPAPTHPWREGLSLRPGATVGLLVGCLLLNLAGRVFVLGTHVPLYLDMVGTAIAALCVGPWAAVLVGVSTSVAGAAIDGWI